MKVIIDNKIPFIRDVLEPFVDVEYHPGAAIDAELVRDADALIIRTRTRCNANLLEGSSVKFIATATIGFDHIDAEYCRSKGIVWTNAPGCNSGSVYQYVAAALLHWSETKGVDLNERVLGVVGIGNVGSKIVRLAECLGLRVVLNDPPKERSTGACGFISLKGLLREADILSFHVPLTPSGPYKTLHMVDNELIAMLNPSGLIINTSRGEVIDQNALISGFRRGNPADYIFDVWENEPDISDDLLKNAFLATPHIAGYSADGKALGTQMSVQALSRFFDLGIEDWEPDTIPDPENQVLQIDCPGKSFQQIATELVLQTYPIVRDHNQLMAQPSAFEQLRGDYPVRREFHAYTVEASNLNEDYFKRLVRMGFKVKRV